MLFSYRTKILKIHFQKKMLSYLLIYLLVKENIYRRVCEEAITFFHFQYLSVSKSESNLKNMISELNIPWRKWIRYYFLYVKY